MRIGGLQKLTTLDFPGVVSALVFAQGCNFYCPYCHNAQLIPMRSALGAGQATDVEDVLAFLAKRAGLLDGVVISGGEPCLQPGLGDFCRAVKALGYKLKLDTNGSFPREIEALLSENLLDYVAVDVKCAPDEYAPLLCRDSTAGEKLRQTFGHLVLSGIPFEARSTCVFPYVDARAIIHMAEIIPARTPWFLQRANLDAQTDLRALDAEEIAELLDMARKEHQKVSIR